MYIQAFLKIRWSAKILFKITFLIFLHRCKMNLKREKLLAPCKFRKSGVFSRRGDSFHTTQWENYSSISHVKLFYIGVIWIKKDGEYDIKITLHSGVLLSRCKILTVVFITHDYPLYTNITRTGNGRVWNLEFAGSFVAQISDFQSYSPLPVVHYIRTKRT